MTTSNWTLEEEAAAIEAHQKGATRTSYLGYTIILNERTSTIITPGGARINAGRASFAGIRRIIKAHRNA